MAGFYNNEVDPRLLAVASQNQARGSRLMSDAAASLSGVGQTIQGYSQRQQELEDNAKIMGFKESADRRAGLSLAGDINTQELAQKRYADDKVTSDYNLAVNTPGTAEFNAATDARNTANTLANTNELNLFKDKKGFEYANRVKSAGKDNTPTKSKEVDYLVKQLGYKHSDAVGTVYGKGGKGGRGGFGGSSTGSGKGGSYDSKVSKIIGQSGNPGAISNAWNDWESAGGNTKDFLNALYQAGGDDMENKGYLDFGNTDLDVSSANKISKAASKKKSFLAGLTGKRDKENGIIEPPVLQAPVGTVPGAVGSDGGLRPLEGPSTRPTFGSALARQGQSIADAATISANNTDSFFRNLATGDTSAEAESMFNVPKTVVEPLNPVGGLAHLGKEDASTFSQLTNLYNNSTNLSNFERTNLKILLDNVKAGSTIAEAEAGQKEADDVDMAAYIKDYEKQGFKVHKGLN